MSLQKEFEEVVKDVMEIDSLAANATGRVRAMKEEIELMEKSIESLDRRVVAFRAKVNRLRTLLSDTEKVAEVVSLKVVGDP